MPIKRIHFAPRRDRDMHVLRNGQSRELETSLVLTGDPLPGTTANVLKFLRQFKDDAAAAGTNDVEIVFRPVFPATLQGDEFVGRGIRVHRSTGVVRFEPGPPPLPVCNNFLIEAVVVTNIGGPQNIPPVVIRVHAHDSVLRIWLTPDPLTIRLPPAPPATDDARYRFTVRAEFGDGTIGDVTLGQGISWFTSDRLVTPKDPPWDEGYIRIPGGVLAGQTFEVTAQVPGAWGGVLFAKGTVKVATAWATDPLMPKAQLIDGDSVRPAESVPNVLFFGDGFASRGDVRAFDTTIGAVVHELTHKEMFRPFDILAGSMNYWSVAGTASARGISVRCEVFPDNQLGSMLQAHTIPHPRRPPPTGEWSIRNLIFAAGLPVSSDPIRLGLTTDPDKAISTLRQEWATTMRADFQSAAGDPTRLPASVIVTWLKYSARTFVDELDNFPAMAQGEPPAAGNPVATALGIHEDRGGLGAIRQFCRGLSAANGMTVAGGPVGRLWGDDDPSFRFKNTGLIVFAAAFRVGTPSTDKDGIRVLFREDEDEMRVGARVTPIPGKPELKIDPAEPLADPKTAAFIIAETVGHELCHQFGLGDEYGGEFPNFDRDERWLDDAANLTSLAAIQKPDPADGNTLKIDVDEIKWNWERIRRAAVISGPLVPSPGSIEIPVLDGHAAAFVLGDPVRLRVRKWRDVLGLRPKTHPFEFTVTSVDPPGNKITVGYPLATIPPADLADFGAGSVAYVPVLAPAWVRSATYPYAKLISPRAEELIRKRNGALSTWPCDAEMENKAPFQSRLPEAVDFWTAGALWSHRDNSTIVGLYSAGELYACGVFHPAGSCILRGKDPAELRKFCAVCRYVLVDAIDPSMHFWIDADYEAIYFG